MSDHTGGCEGNQCPTAAAFDCPKRCPAHSSTSLDQSNWVVNQCVYESVARPCARRLCSIERKQGGGCACVRQIIVRAPTNESRSRIIIRCLPSCIHPICTWDSPPFPPKHQPTDQAGGSGSALKQQGAGCGQIDNAHRSRRRRSSSFITTRPRSKPPPPPPQQASSINDGAASSSASSSPLSSSAAAACSCLSAGEPEGFGG
jgi:hypothetical protein